MDPKSDPPAGAGVDPNKEPPVVPNPVLGAGVDDPNNDEPPAAAGGADAGAAGMARTI